MKKRGSNERWGKGWVGEKNVKGEFWVY